MSNKESDMTPLLAKDLKEINKSEIKDEPLEFINESIMYVNWKLKILLFLIFLLISSTMFIHDVIGKFGTDTIRDQFSTTNKGTIIQGVLFVLIYSMFENLMRSKIL
jgi:hypothetical protein